MQEVAPHPVHAHPFVEEGGTLFGLVLRVSVLVLAKLVDPVGELALEPVVADTVPDKVLTELVLQFFIALESIHLRDAIMLVGEGFLLVGIINGLLVRALGEGAVLCLLEIVERVVAVRVEVH